MARVALGASVPEALFMPAFCAGQGELCVSATNWDRYSVGKELPEKHPRPFINW